MLSEREAALEVMRSRIAWREALDARERAAENCEIEGWVDRRLLTTHGEACTEVARCRGAWEAASTAHKEILAWQDGA